MTLGGVEEWLIHTALLGQGIFVGAWARLPWWRTVVGRALMVKSVALLVLLAWAVAAHWWALPGGPLLEVVVFGAVWVGIWSQAAALLWEMYAARRDDRRLLPSPSRDT